MKPTIGRIVHYTLSETDSMQINKRRRDADNLNGAGVTLKSQSLGPQIHIGNPASEGQIYPAMVVRDFRGQSYNLQVFLDGNDVFWATSVSEGTGPRTWAWPTRER